LCTLTLNVGSDNTEVGDGNGSHVELQHEKFLTALCSVFSPLT